MTTSAPAGVSPVLWSPVVGLWVLADEEDAWDGVVIRRSFVGRCSIWWRVNTG